MMAKTITPRKTTKRKAADKRRKKTDVLGNYDPISVIPVPDWVTGGGTVDVTITLNAVVSETEGQAVNVAYNCASGCLPDAPACPVPVAFPQTAVTVEEGQQSVTLSLQTTQVAYMTDVVIVASIDGSPVQKAGVLTVCP
jgi:hypothetical protein